MVYNMQVIYETCIILPMMWSRVWEWTKGRH